MKNKIIATSVIMMSLLGGMSVANATVPTDEEVSQAQSGEKPASAPEGYYEYGLGQVKADGQWVNDN